MAQTPTDPTKAQVWITKGIDDLDFEFYFPQGPKGDAGGFTLGTALDNTIDTGTGKYNLNDVIVSGIYRLTATVDGLLIRNYPRNYDTGILEVFERVPGQTVIQVWHCINQTARIKYERTYVTGTWSPWRLYTSSRVDQTAGRAIYMFDDINGREQLVYGDTGLRSMPLPANVTSGVWYLRREGSKVSLYTQLTGINNNTGQDLHGYDVMAAGSIPVGFQPPVSVPLTGFGRVGVSNQRQPLMAFLYGNGRIALEKDETNTNGAIINNTAASFYFSVTYDTTQSWPTTLPGTASGGIPNI
ncbi:hypothetical protein QCN37_gp23 [Arthrobacter phage Tatanka]|uniref:Minor tail protein n=1 Tax=Arthrobacter phage Tatanka TaxID=2250368 RepID=A0A2Z5HEU0_9CAUD|nr:hypothetical protein QCN37_gp23 [Arthrobacter phage Tatanka]AXC38649.1 hypothetical protein SEA_TATANKA_23 [Arthrobacter phage Tatanka]